MIISHERKFIFVRTEKTASTSIELFLSQFCGALDVITPFVRSPEESWRAAKGVNPRNYGIVTLEFRGDSDGPDFDASKPRLRFKQTFFDHTPAHEIRELIPTCIWDQYYKVAFERNPWDKTISHYYFERRKDNSYTLEEYFNNKVFPINYPKYTDPQDHDRIIVDHVSLYENLDRELTEFCARLDIPFAGKLDVFANSSYRKDRRHYRQILSAKQSEIVARAFEQEIKLFGYSY